MIPYVAGTKEGWVDGLKVTFAFSLSRLLAYTLMGLLAGLSGELLIGIVGRSEFGLYIWIIAGLFVSLLGVLILLGRDLKAAPCRLLMRYTLDDNLKSMGFLGFMIGITPCAPLLGVLTYIAFSVKTPLLGAFYALCFGLGASVTTPITVLGVFAGVFPRLIFKMPRMYEIFKRSCGFILFFLGIRLVLSQIFGRNQYW